MLKLYNSLTRSKDNFKSIEKGKAKVFSCGPSIYQRPHIGNYRTFLYEDMLIKFLKYSGYKVEYSTILTDIEDKSLSEAKKEHKAVNNLTENVAEIFFKEAKLLNINLPDPVPRSSTSIKESAHLIKTLMEKGYAYRYKGDIFFDPLKFKGFGKLFRLDMKRWPKKKVRFKKDTYHGRRWNLGDFILWHGYQDKDKSIPGSGSTFWDTEIGKGRPSWNIQDPAVIIKELGYRVDINCGGIDNIYRHHDYTIAIIESVSGKDYANYYLHGEHLIVNGRSMSKSRKNILYPEDVLKTDKSGKYKPYHLRFFLLYTYYRKKLNFTIEKFIKSSSYIDAIRAKVNYLLKTEIKNPETKSEVTKLISEIETIFADKMDDDLGFGEAIDGIAQILNKLAEIKKKESINKRQLEILVRVLKKIDTVTGIFF